MSTKISDLINPTVRDVVPWTENTLYVSDRIVIVGNSLLKCISTHTSSPSIITDIQSGNKWFTLSPFPMSKSEREAIVSPVNGTQILQNNDIPYIYTYLNGNWMLQNYTSSFLRVVSSAKQVPVVSTSVKFGTTECLLGSSVSYNNTTGIFTVLGGGIYEFKGGLGTCYSGVAAGWISSSWQMSIDGTNWTKVGEERIDLVATNSWNHVPNLNDAGGTLKFDQTTYLRYIPTNVSSVTQIGDNSVLSLAGTNQYCWAEITEKSRDSNFNVTLSSDYIQEWTNYTPLLTATTTNPALGTSAVVNARYSVIGKTLKLNVNIYNPNAGTLGSGNYQISIPSGFTIDTTKVRTTTIGYDGSTLGACLVTIGSGWGANGKVVAVSSSQLGLYCAQAWNTNTPMAFWSAAFHGTGANICISFTAELPIL